MSGHHFLAQVISRLLGEYVKHLTILLLLLSFSLGLKAQVLVIQFSDTHSIYENVEAFVYSINREIKKFKVRYPTGKLAFLHSGDISGPSMHTHFDMGTTNYDVMRGLVGDSFFAITMGNHDGIDWNFETFIEQQKAFEKMMTKGQGKDWRMLCANVSSLRDASDDLYRPYQDLVTESGHKLRVVGLVLDQLTLYNSGIDDYLDVQPMLEASKKQMIKAKADGVGRVIFSAHEEIENMKKFESGLSDWLATRPELRSIKMDLMFAAHDHKVLVHPGKRARIVDSGTGYNHFSTTILDEDLEIISKPKHFSVHDDLPSKRVMNSYLSPEARQVVKLANKQIVLSSEKNKVVVGRNPIDIAARIEVKKAPHEGGIAVANSLREWGKASMNQQQLSSVEGHLGFVNSGSFRSNEIIPKGDLTFGQVNSINSYTSDAKLFLLKGEHIQKMYREVREFLPMGEHSPQLSWNLKEYPLGSKILFFRNSTTGSWSELDPTKTYSLALGHWLGKNGFKLPAFDAAFATGEEIVPKLRAINEVIAKYLPSVLEKDGVKIQKFCKDLLK